MHALVLLSLAQTASLEAAKEAYEGGRHFELARRVDALDVQRGVGAFLEGYVLAGRNQSEKALVSLKRTAQTTTGIWWKRSLETMATTFARVGRYQLAARSLRAVLDAKDFKLTKKELQDTEN